MYSSFLALASDRYKDISFGEIFTTPFQLGAWSLLEPMGEQNHAPQLCWIRPNLLGCVWMAGDGEGKSGMCIYLSLLSEEAKCWLEPQVVSQDEKCSEQNPLLFVSDGCLHLIHSAQHVRSPEDISWRNQETSFSMQWTAALRHQSLPLESLNPMSLETWGRDAWSDAEDLLNTPAFCRHPPHPLSDGTWLLPIYRTLEAGGAFGHDYTEVLRLNSKGRTTSKPVEIPQSVGRVHGSIVSSENGETLLMFLRSRLADCIYLSTSCDGGKHWSKPAATELPNNNSSIQACRLASGRLALIFNRFGFAQISSDSGEHAHEWGNARWPRTRWPLSIAISDDDGLSWPWIRDIDSGFGFCGQMNWDLNGQLAYPSLIEGCDGDLHIAYSWASRQAIRYVTFREKEIIGYDPEVIPDPHPGHDR